MANLVLIVEDDPSTLGIIRQLLELSGHQTLCAEDSMLAYGLLASEHPDVIITDIMMPRIDGLGFIRWIRSSPEYASIPIIAMTAYGEEYLKQAEEVGANASVRKPDQIIDLPRIVAGYLEPARPDSLASETS